MGKKKIKQNENQEEEKYRFAPEILAQAKIFREMLEKGHTEHIMTNEEAENQINNDQLNEEKSNQDQGEQNQDEEIQEEQPNEYENIEKEDEDEEIEQQEMENEDEDEVDDDQNEAIEENEQNEEQDEESELEKDEYSDLDKEAEANQGIEEEQEEGVEEKKSEEIVLPEIKVKGGQTDLLTVKMEMHELLEKIVKYKTTANNDKTRQELMDEFLEKLQIFYGYNMDLLQVFSKMYAPVEMIQFLEANELQPLSSIRANTLKTRRKELAQTLIQRGVTLDSIGEWSKVGMKILSSKVPIGATPEYLAGHYMLQSSSSLLPVIALAPELNERILDMSAAPGGKTSYIAQLMKNTGILVANDLKEERLKGLHFNLQRLGVTNTIVCNYDGRKFPHIMNNFDRVLLDAPCTGLGIICRDPQIKCNKTLRDIRISSHLEKELILSAIDCCKKGGIIVYSTCSVTVHENEWVVDYALKNRHVKLVETGITLGSPGFIKYQEKRFDPSIKLTIRVQPHIDKMDGFFIAKFKKLDDGPKRNKEAIVERENDLKMHKKAKKEKRIKRQAERHIRKMRKRENELQKEQEKNIVDDDTQVNTMITGKSKKKEVEGNEKEIEKSTDKKQSKSIEKKIKKSTVEKHINKKSDKNIEKNIEKKSEKTEKNIEKKAVKNIEKKSEFEKTKNIGKPIQKKIKKTEMKKGESNANKQKGGKEAKKRVNKE